MKSAIEGECDPVFWQGIPVGYIRKYDNRLRIEMLRAHMPKVFKTPGAKVAINTGTVNNNTVIVDAEEMDRLIALRQESLRRIRERKALASGTAPRNLDHLKVRSASDVRERDATMRRRARLKGWLG